MKGKLGLAFTLLVLIFGSSSPGLAEVSSQDLFDRLEEDGWTEISPGVMQRTREDNKVETLGFGAEGLRFQLETMKEHLAFLRTEYARQPSRELRRALRAHRAEVLRIEAVAREAEADGRLGFSTEALEAGAPGCLVNYDVSVEAFPISQGGAGARASAYFKGDCGQEGDVYAMTSATATAADNTVTIRSLNDPTTAPEPPRIGSNVRAVSSVGVSVNGVKACYSKAEALSRNYDLEVFYSLFTENYVCTGPAEIRPFAVDAPSNLTLSNSPPPVDPNSAAMIANLNSSLHKAHLYEFGRTVYDASAATATRTIVCTKTWGTCGLTQAPINPGWKAPSGSEGAMVVIDSVNRKIYHFYQLVTNPDGTVKINADGTVTTGWGDVSDLDGNGQVRALGGSNLSYMFGTVRVFEMARAAADPQNAIQHALAFSSQYTCDTWRYPATKSNGTSTVASCIPVGSRVFLDSTADCSTVSPVGEKAICYALKKYGAYAIGTGGLVFGLKFEVPTYGQPGGSGADPYPGVGITADGYDLSHIPWAKLKVAADCQCSSSDLAAASGRPFAEKAASNEPLASRALDPNNAAMIANLNSSLHKAHLYQFGRTVYDASLATATRTIVCTKPWGTCGLTQAPIHPSWKPASGSEGAMAVIDYINRKVYNFYELATNLDGTVKINADGSVSTGWADVADLDGNGQVAKSLGGSNLSYLFGTVRVFEMARAAADPANAIQHALAFTSEYACSGSWRYPATKSNGLSTAAGCLPVGSRVFLDSTADCSTVSPVGEKAVCYALQKYGAYLIGTGGLVFGLKFEVPTDINTGGSGPDPYPGVGLAGDGYDMLHIPWSRLKVGDDCQCTPY
jgi:hypothetical protein